MKMIKKFGMLALASMMALSALSVAAAETITVEEAVTTKKPDVEATLDIAATTVGAVINIDVPTTAAFILNPYKLEDKAQVLSPDLTITNYSNVDINVKLNNLVAKVEGEGVTLAAAPVLSTSIKKEVFVWMNVKGSGEYAAYDAKTDVTKIAKTTGFKALSLGDLAKSADQSAAGGAITMKIDGNMSTSVVWADTDKVTVTPTYAFVPTIITP